MLRDQKILITGPAGQIAFPIAESLSKENEVWGIARFNDRQSRERVEAVGVTTRVCDIATGDFSALPSGFTSRPTRGPKPTTTTPSRSTQRVRDSSCSTVPRRRPPS